MAKRFTASEIWLEDWFLDIPVGYKLFWYYMLSQCDHAGLFKVNIKLFCGLNGVKLTSSEALKYFNTGKQRIRVISDSLWLIEDFFVYQYGETFNCNNRVHKSILDLYEKHGISLTSIRGLKDLKDRVKDKDKDKDIIVDNSIKAEKKSKMPLASDFNGLPENKMIAVKELFFRTQKADVSDDDINGLWVVFKIQNLTGKKFYQNEDDVYSHFINWSKTQKIAKHGQQSVGGSPNTVTKHNAGALELLRKGKEEYAQFRGKEDNRT